MMSGTPFHYVWELRRRANLGWSGCPSSHLTATNPGKTARKTDGPRGQAGPVLLDEAGLGALSSVVSRVFPSVKHVLPPPHDLVGSQAWLQAARDWGGVGVS